MVIGVVRIFAARPMPHAERQQGRVIGIVFLVAVREGILERVQVLAEQLHA